DRDQGPFPPRALPGSSVLWTHPTSGRAGAIPRGLAVARWLPTIAHPIRSLLFHVHPCRACCHQPPRQDRSMHMSFTSRSTSAFPVIMAGRLLRQCFGAHSVFTRVAARTARWLPKEPFLKVL